RRRKHQENSHRCCSETRAQDVVLGHASKKKTSHTAPESQGCPEEGWHKRGNFRSARAQPRNVGANPPADCGFRSGIKEEDCAEKPDRRGSEPLAPRRKSRFGGFRRGEGQVPHASRQKHKK